MCQIGKECTRACHHCEASRDTAQHTLEKWNVLRRDLCNEIGNDLSLRVIVTKMLGSERSWKAVASFCEQVMSQKEAAERIRRQEAETAAAAAAAAAAGGNDNDDEEEDRKEEEETSVGWSARLFSSLPPSSKTLRSVRGRDHSRLL